MKKKYNGWKRKVNTKILGEKVFLESMDNEYWIIPQKLGVEAMQRIIEISKLDIDPDDVQTDDIDKIQDDVARKIVKKGQKNIGGDVLDMAKIAFLHGVYDHNFDEPDYILDENGKPKEIEVENENGEIELQHLCHEDKKGNPEMKKSIWGESLFEGMSNYWDLVMEIFRVVMANNKAPKKKSV